MLTQRENEVLTLIERGYSTKQIAETLSVGKRTVEKHSQKIFKKLNIKSRLNLVKGQDETVDTTLSNVQKDIINYVCKGMSTKEIAREMCMSVATITLNLTKIYQQLGVKGRLELVAKYKRNMNYIPTGH